MLQSFIKIVNYQHMMPTRYTLDVDLKSIVTVDVVDNSTKRKEVRLVSMPQLTQGPASLWWLFTPRIFCVATAAGPGSCQVFFTEH